MCRQPRPGGDERLTSILLGNELLIMIQLCYTLNGIIIVQIPTAEELSKNLLCNIFMSMSSPVLKHVHYIKLSLIHVYTIVASYICIYLIRLSIISGWCKSVSCKLYLKY